MVILGRRGLGVQVLCLFRGGVVLQCWMVISSSSSWSSISLIFLFRLLVNCPDCLSKSAGNVMVVGVFTDTTRNSCMMSLPVCLFYPRLILSIADLFSIVIHSFPIYFFEFFKLCWLRLLSYKTARNLFPALALHNTYCKRFASKMQK